MVERRGDLARPQAVIFTDLDGTLLDHDSYSWDSARPMLERLKRLGIPVVLASSKTAAEMTELRARMGLGAAPMICENGAGVIGAGQGDDVPRDGYARLRAVLGRLDAALRGGFEGFGDMGPERIAEVTGLSRADAERAADRAFSEPGLWHGSEVGKAAFLAALQAQGITARTGGRFLTLSFGGTKADRIAKIAGLYGNPVTIALGDALNDVEMLEGADHGVIVANPHHPPLPALPGEAAGRIRRTGLPGPAGWSAALAALVSELGIDDDEEEPDRG